MGVYIISNEAIEMFITFFLIYTVNNLTRLPVLYRVYSFGALAGSVDLSTIPYAAFHSSSFLYTALQDAET